MDPGGYQRDEAAESDGTIGQNSEGGASDADVSESQSSGPAFETETSLSQSSDGGANDADGSASQSSDGGASEAGGALSRNSGGGASDDDCSLSQSQDLHQITIKFSVYYLSRKGEAGFRANINIGCPRVPTLWSCEIVLTQAGEDDPTGCISFKLRRTDFAPNPVDVNISLVMSDASTNTIYERWDKGRKSVNSGDIIFEPLIQKFPITETATFFYKKLYLMTYIEVYSCHLDQFLAS